MAIDAPTWATPELVAEYGAYFLCCFQNRAHFEHAMATGDLRRPASIRAAAKRAADPVRAQRESLRRPVANARCAVRDAERQIAEARAELARPHSLDAYRAELTLKAQQTRLEERTTALKAAETDLELFDLLHTEIA